MQGIVYIRFDESLEEIRTEIVKELEAAGYKI
jgi:predicted nucleotide-binding protein